MMMMIMMVTAMMIYNLYNRPYISVTVEDYSQTNEHAYHEVRAVREEVFLAICLDLDLAAFVRGHQPGQNADACFKLKIQI